MTESTSETAAGLIVDADGHLCEPADLWERNLPASMRDRGIRLRWNEATGFDECLVEDTMATERGLVGLGNAGESYENFGQGRHYEDCNPAGFDAHERVKVLDSEGIDISVMYPGLGLKLGGITDARLAVESCAVYNDWVAEWCSVAPDRLKGVGALPMQDPAESTARRTGSATEVSLRGSPGPTPTTTARSTIRRTRRSGKRSRRPVSRSVCTSPASPTCRARRAACVISWHREPITR